MGLCFNFETAVRLEVIPLSGPEDNAKNINNISQLVRALLLVNWLAGRTLVYGPLNSKVCFSRACKMSLEENFETYLKVKYANEEKEQSTETNVLTTQVAFLWKTINCPHV